MTARLRGALSGKSARASILPARGSFSFTAQAKEPMPSSKTEKPRRPELGATGCLEGKFGDPASWI